VPFVLWLLAVGTFAIGTDAFVIAGVLPELAADLSISVGTAGQLVTVFSIAYAVFAPISATLTGSLPRRTVLLTALVVFSLGNIISATASSFFLVALGRVVAAAGAASFTPQASGVAAALVPEGRRGSALSIVIGGLTLSTALGVPIGTLVGSRLGWRATLWLVAALGLLSLLGVAARLPALPPGGAHTLRDRLSPLRSPAVLATLTVTLLAVCSEHLIYTYIGPVLQSSSGGGGGALSVLLLVFGVGAMVGNAIAGPATDRFSDRAVLWLSVGGMTLDLALIPWTFNHPVLAGVSMFVWGMTGWMYLVPQQHRLLSLASRQGAFTVSLNSSALYLGIALGGAIGGVLVTVMEPRMLGLPAALVGVGALVVASFADRLVAAEHGQREEGVSADKLAT
jgi:predicted MFS family arabinose efflux permease